MDNLLSHFLSQEKGCPNIDSRNFDFRTHDIDTKQDNGQEIGAFEPGWPNHSGFPPEFYPFADKRKLLSEYPHLQEMVTEQFFDPKPFIYGNTQGSPSALPAQTSAIDETFFQESNFDLASTFNPYMINGTQNLFGRETATGAADALVGAECLKASVPSIVNEHGEYIPFEPTVCEAPTALRGSILQPLLKDEVANQQGIRRNTNINLNGVLEAWYKAHLPHPYPSKDEKFRLSVASGTSFKQVHNWFANKRSRYRIALDPSSSCSTSTASGDVAPASSSIPKVESTETNGSMQWSYQPGRKGKQRYTHASLLKDNHDLASLGQKSIIVPWPCTFPFCRKVTKNRYEWKRHESSHIPGTWICMPDNTPIIANSCSICGIYNPDAVHLSGHFDINVCTGKDPRERAFSRKDKLYEHIRRVHLKRKLPSLELSQSTSALPSLLTAWKRTPQLQMSMPEGLWCGFCSSMLSNWEERQEHVGNHIQSGVDTVKWNNLL
ncbi:hypothetical protein EJ08DRAFT_340801 [Tothia fuscella]|uniref:Homeobox domain-containing protein n=1 Tax=Tothia fuscella TaxID=1048955 RepID=A0A9P4P140_9PEZI|nr:hypothetical protein EJ08DRAFT_340801 [Tothia fuscella]